MRIGISRPFNKNINSQASILKKCKPFKVLNDDDSLTKMYAAKPRQNEHLNYTKASIYVKNLI